MGQVYFLFGRDDTTNDIAIAYIGEAEEIYPRLQQHQDKDFWTEALVFVSKYENLSKAHIKFLEHTIHQTAIEAAPIPHRKRQHAELSRDFRS